MAENEEITPESTYLNRRLFLQSSILAGSLLATGGAYRFFTRHNPAREKRVELPKPPPLGPGDEATSFHDITHYNNFYEFSTSKEAVAQLAAGWNPDPWSIEVGGLVRKPRVFKLEELLAFPQEERVYRFRCVEGWSMVIPWRGFPLARLLESVEPQNQATHVAFESYFQESAMPHAGSAGIPFPYVEGLRLDEALHPLTLLATGLYGKPLPNQNGARVRLVVPWKYGFKSIKSVVKVTLTDREPPTTWSQANPDEYGFFSNVNPEVSHPRWSQARERRIGERGLRPTLAFNGYGNQVEHLYRGMDLRRHF